MVQEGYGGGQMTEEQRQQQVDPCPVLNIISARYASETVHTQVPSCTVKACV